MGMAKMKLRVEALECREVPATFTVDNQGDSGVGSLRYALSLANANPGADTINFLPALKGSLLYLTSGQLTVSDTLTISGAEESFVTIDGQFQRRLFESSAS